MPFMSGRLMWEREGRDWPNRDCSRFVRAAGITWHVQQCGAGPVMLLLHGTGSATHSWRDLMPPLARHFTVVALDLPGHGFTGAVPSRLLSLAGMASAIREMLKTLGVSPVIGVGHSAGAAVLARMVLDQPAAIRGLVSLNGALLPMRGLPGHLFSPVAKLLVSLPMVPELFAWRAGDSRAVPRLIDNTGSTIDPVGVELYARLVRSPAHVGAALGMMANWDLKPLEQDLGRLPVPLAQIIGANDRTIPPAEANRVAEIVPNAKVVVLPKLGHLAHEERPEEVAELIHGFARDWGVT